MGAAKALARAPAVFSDRVEIPLTRGKVAIVDVEDADLGQRLWTAKPDDRTWYAVRSFWVPDKKKIQGEWLHKLVAARMGIIGQLPDHIDRDGLNCRRSNLRAANASQNSYNRNRRIDNSTGTTGVYWNKKLSKWRVLITADKKIFHIGYFYDLELACLVRHEAEAKFHGEFARRG